MIQILFEKVEMRIKKLFLVSGSAFRVASPKRSESLCEATTVFLLRGQRGISLIELIMFIMIVSVALAGILLVMNVTTKSSADPLVHKQALAIAESLLEEVELMPFTYCDPDDPAAALLTTTSTAACTQIENSGPELAFGAQTSNETRYGPSNFDNVNDYNGCQMNTGVVNTCDITGTNGIRDINNSLIGPATGYRASIAVAINGMPAAGASLAIPNTEALLITVTVTGPDNVGVVLEGIRTRYSPRGVP
jgi:MSHA pilin protein MshD